MARRKAKKVGLPQEIIFDILIQLPPKSIGQFRCVSKQWCTLLSDPKFLKAHHNIHAHKGERKLIFISGFNYLHTITFKPQKEYELYYLIGISRKLNFQQLSNKWNIIVGSCNGLVLVVDEQHIRFLINPTTLKYHQIPNFELAPPKPDRYSIGMCGLGYDSATDDYKVVALSRFIRPSNTSTCVDVYSVKEGFWRRLESSPFDEAHPMITSGLLLNGALHWYADKNGYQSVIVAFDLSGETFLELRTPKCYEEVVFLHNLVVLRGCLCMVTDSEENKLDVLMMKDYGVEESWTKFSFTIPDSMFIRPLPMCLTSDDDVVLDVVLGVVDRRKLIVYNIKEDLWWYMMVDGINLRYKSSGIFIDTLVSPTFGKGTEGYFIA